MLKILASIQKKLFKLVNKKVRQISNLNLYKIGYIRSWLFKRSRKHKYARIFSNYKSINFSFKFFLMEKKKIKN